MAHGFAPGMEGIDMARKSRKVPYVVEQKAVMPPEDETALYIQPDFALPTGAYIRLSAENSGNDTDDTLKTQITLVESFIKEREDLILKNTYIDNGFTGTNFERPEFLRLMEDVKRGVIRCIVVKDLSRFGRDYLETGYYLETIFPLLNVRFIAITDNYDSYRAEDRNNLAIPIKNMVNAMYAKDFSRKQEAFQEMCRKTGRYVRKGVPYGYIYSEEKGRLIIDKSVEPYVRLVFAWTLAGISRSEVARRMEILNAPTAWSKDYGKTIKWTTSTVKGILFNPVYAGFHVMGKSRVSTYRGIKPQRVERDEWLYFPDFHEAYITMDDYQIIEKMISSSRSDCYKRMAQHAESRERMKDCFPGMVFCADCGRQMMFCRGSHHRDYSERSFQYYRCRYDKQFQECSNTIVQQNYLKIVVMDQLRVFIKTCCDKAKVIAALENKQEKTKSVNTIQRNINRLLEKESMISDKMMKAYIDFAEGLLDEEAYQMIKEKHNIEKNDVIGRRREFEQRLLQAEKSIQRFCQMTKHLEEYLEGTGFKEELVKEMVSKIIVGKDNSIELVLKCKDVFTDPLIDEFMEGAE